MKISILQKYFLVLMLIIQVNVFAKAPLTKEQFNQLRNEVLKMRATARDNAIMRVDDILIQYDHALTTRQRLRLLYAKALFQL